MTEKHLGQTGTHEGIASDNQTDVRWTKGCSFFATYWIAGHKLVGPHERSLEPVTDRRGQ